MNRFFTYIFALCIISTVGELVAQPWAYDVKTSKLPTKDKEKLNTLQTAVYALLGSLATGDTSSSSYRTNLKLFNTTLAELDKQIKSIVSTTGSLSGMMSELKWHERLQELKKSLNFLLAQINESTVSSEKKRNLINGLTETISTIQAKEPR